MFVVVVVVVVVRRRFATSTGENWLSLSTVVRLTHFWTGVKLEEVCVAQASSFLVCFQLLGLRLNASEAATRSCEQGPISTRKR